MIDEQINEEKDREESPKKKKGKKSFLKIMTTFFLLVVLGLVGFGGWTYYKTHLAIPSKPVEEARPLIGSVWPMGGIIVNLMDNNGERYLKVVVDVEVPSMECINELNVLKPKIMDSMIDLFSSKKYTEIAGFDGKQRLRDEIAVRINNYLSKGRISRVYFTEFVIQ